MSLWTRISQALAALANGEGLGAVFDRLRAVPNAENSVGFTIAILALAAKMAKADGTVTRDEVSAFRSIFTLPAEEEENAARVFNLARQDVAGFDSYARKVAALFNPAGQTLCADDHNILIDILEALFAIAMADGAYHPREDAFLAQVAQIFGLDARCFGAVRARYVMGAPRDPFAVLGAAPGASLDDLRAAWKAAVKANHPDGMIARGVPPEAVQLAARRLVAINAAWREVQSLRASA
ncbi:MAG: molecular chaperone DjiA [Cypionkella sp.]|nr:molecular chaperone DjiA [Cypionkella sp.]